MQATETSTGVRHCVPACRRAAERQQERSAAGGRRHHRPRHHRPGHGRLGRGRAHRRLAEGGDDSTGASVPGRQREAWDRMEATYNPRYYFDLRKERKNAKKGESAYTPAVALIAALGAALDWIAAQGDGGLAEGPRALIENAETIAAMTRAAVRRWGLSSLLRMRLGRCGHGRAATGGRGLRRHREGAEVALRRDHHQRTGRDEGQDLPHRAPGLLRLHGHHRAASARWSRWP